VHNIEQETDSSHDFVINHVLVNSVAEQLDCNSDWIEPLIINQQVVPVKLDSCAQTNVMSHADWKTLTPRPTIHPTDIRLQAYPNFQIPVMGKCVTDVQLKDRSYKVQFIVVPGKSPALLGRNACVKLDLVRRVNVVSAAPFDNVLDDYPDLFEGLGCLPGTVHIKLKPDAEPVVETCRRVPFSQLEPLKEELDKMVKARIIEPVEEPTEWVHALHLVTKPNGQLRVCIDPRNLNKSIQREHFSLPTREEITEKFAHCKYFTKLDATKGFWQMRLDEESSSLLFHHTIW
jgi:hypothetical protein